MSDEPAAPLNHQKRYLGDGVYVSVDPGDGMVCLTTENGIRATNTIYLEDAVLEALLTYVQELKSAR